MSTRKYRLASPIDNGKTNVLYPSNIPRWSSRLSNDEVSTGKPFLNDRPKIEDTSEFIPPARWWLVLPCMVLAIVTTASDSLLMNDLIVRRYERRYGLDTTPNAQSRVCRESVSTSRPDLYWQFPSSAQEVSQGRPDYNLVQRDAANFHTKNSIVTLVPALITSIFLGSNCDIIGRRPLLVLPLVGKVIRYILMLIIVSRDLSDTWLLTTHAIEAAFGSIGLVMLSTFAYITDCTQGSTRTRAFLIAEAIAVVARIVPALAVGVWLRYYLYIAPLSVCLGLSVIALLYALFLQPESVKSVQKNSLIRQLMRIRFKPIIHAITVFTVKRTGNKRQQLILITIVIMLLQSILSGYFSVFSLYLYGRPMCLDALHVSLLSSVHAIVVFVLSILAALSKKSLDRTYVLAVLGSFAAVADLIILGFAKTVWLLYVAVAIGSLFFITLPVLRTKLTETIEKNEYAIVFIAPGIIETVGHSVVGAIANRVYNASLTFFPGLILVVFGSTGIIPIVIMGYLAFSERKSSTSINAKATVDNDMKV